MVDLVVLCMVVLPFLAVTGSASVLEDLDTVSSEVVDLNSNFAKHGKVAAAWWAGWHPDLLPLDKVSWKKYTHMTYAFAETTPSVDELSISGGEELLAKFVSAAKKHKVKALISIGGWTGSRFFSTAVGSAANRTAFVKTITNLVKKHKLDGIDFDWEYPNHPGIGCNTISKQDTPNFLSFLRELRAHHIGRRLILTAAAPITPWPDPNDEPSDISPFAKLLDYIAIMNYDLWGSWSPAVGPNAPLNDTCAPPQYQQGSAVSAVQAWTSAGLPRNQFVLGVGAYGHSFLVANSVALTDQGTITAYPQFEPKQPRGDSSDSGSGVDVCGAAGGWGGIGWGGTFNFWGLVEGKFLDEKGQPLQGIHYRYDECSQTPYVYNHTSQVMVSFDDAKSFKAKGEFIKNYGLRGYAMWEAASDHNDILIDSIRKGGGY
ncbi:chitinase [Thelephora ganbajun]|uniref:Chitinase n=1 Tax=Thelephora ganbajun TaxID=370292 RepID=A0ACB6ZKK6_THEGA|nr:chitinase [Thelephora ganbajun]